MVPTDFAAIPGLLALAQSPESTPTLSPGTPVQGSPAPTGPAGSGGGAPNPLNGLIWMFLPVLVVMFLISAMGQKKQKKQHAALLGGLKRGDQVLTTAGILGSVVEVNDRDVLLRVDEGSNTRIRFAKTAVQQVIREGRDSARTDVEIKPDASALTDRR